MKLVPIPQFTPPESSNAIFLLVKEALLLHHRSWQPSAGCNQALDNTNNRFRVLQLCLRMPQYALYVVRKRPKLAIIRIANERIHDRASKECATLFTKTDQI